MSGTQSAVRRRGLGWLLAGSCVTVALVSAGCINPPKRGHDHAGAAGTAGARATAGGSGGRGGAVGDVGEAGEAGANTEAEAGASGSLADAGMGGAEGEAGGAPGADAGSGGAQAGSPGEPAETDTFNEPCPSSTLQGWASVAGLELDPALSQPAALEVTVSNATDLALYAASPEPYIIHVSGTITLPDVFSSNAPGALPEGQALFVTSNKTIVGDGRDATLVGGIRIAGTSAAAADMVSNVVIRNLHINAASSATSNLPGESDGIGIAYAHHVWIDHVDIWDAPGDGIDITNGSDYVTVSWSKFRFVDGISPKGARVGDSDANSAEDSGRLKVTFHHIWWTDTVDQRMPRVRFGDVHVFNNYYSHSPKTLNSYAVAAAFESRLLVQNNYFEEVVKPHVFFSFPGSELDEEPTAEMVATGNTYVGRSGDASGRMFGQGASFTPPYPFTLEPADTLLKQFARHCTGPLAATAPPVQP